MADPQQLEEGMLVQYYLGGWRTGHIESLTKVSAVIQPIGTKYKKTRKVTVAHDDIKIHESGKNTLT
jgi:hypothetical protein